MKTAGEENPNSHVRLYNEPTESMGRKLRTILAHSHGLKSKKKSGRRRGVSLDFSFYRTSQALLTQKGSFRDCEFGLSLLLPGLPFEFFGRTIA